MKLTPIDFFARLTYLRRLTVSPRGEAAFLATTVRLEADDYWTDLCLCSDGQGLRRLSLPWSIKDYAWLDDDRAVIATATAGDGPTTAADGSAAGLGEVGGEAKGETKDEAAGTTGDWAGRTTTCRVLNVRDGRTERVVVLPGAAEEVTPAGDGSLVFAAPSPLRPQDAPSAEVWTAEETPFWRDGTGPAAGLRRSLFRLVGEKIVRLTPPELDVGAWRLSGGQITLVGRAVDFAGDGRKFDVLTSAGNHVLLLDLAAGSSRLLAGGEGLLHHLAVRDGENYLVAVNDLKRRGLYEDPRIDKIGPDGRVLGSLNCSGQLRLFNSLASDVLLDAPRSMDIIPHQGGLLTIATVRDHCPVMKGHFRPSSLRPLTAPDFSATEVKIAGDDPHVLYVLGWRRLGGLELHRWDRGSLERLTSFNAQAMAEISPARPRRVARGRGAIGWLLKPRGWRDGRQRPAVLSIHGGPDMAYGPFFVHELQFLAARGFAVLFCNPRGSTGGGRAYADLRGRYGEADVEDVMDFLDRTLAAQPWIDPRRLGVMGGSYGGYLTALLIGRRDVFRAAAAERFEANLISQFLLSEIGAQWLYDAFRADPWTDPAKLWDASPLKYADQVRTPTLILAGGRDHVCEASGAQQLFAALKHHGQKARLTVFETADHSFRVHGRPSWRLRRLKEIADWFAEHLTKTPPDSADREAPESCKNPEGPARS
ncbi:MAG: prolyl oligopeptidase family serine peptidase [Deltaproteobacteria bacterium]|jgi:dipeptidyl aminopeptidase/acylaminoacyl peptidase|nr:prolyl oligopeptidase family serine peptidase [Deltaproteobacteria bacterium]